MLSAENQLEEIDKAATNAIGSQLERRYPFTRHHHPSSLHKGPFSDQLLPRVRITTRVPGHLTFLLRTDLGSPPPTLPSIVIPFETLNRLKTERLLPLTLSFDDGDVAIDGQVCETLNQPARL